MTLEPQERWRVVLFTDGAHQLRWYAAFLRAKGHQLVAVVTSPKRSANFPLEVVREGVSTMDILVSSRPQRWAQLVQAWRPDLIISSKFPQRLPAEVLSLPRLGAVNVHPAPLPRFRGTMTPFWMLRHAEPQGGVTLHRMLPEFDTGPILAQVTFPLSDDDDISTFVQKVITAYAALWEAGLPRIAAGDPGERQDEAAASYFGRVADEEGWRRIDWSQPARTVHNIVRSCGWAGQQPPGALGTLDGVPHRITKTRLATGPQTTAPPGSIVARHSDRLIVQCGNGPLEVISYEPLRS